MSKKKLVFAKKTKRSGAERRLGILESNINYAPVSPAAYDCERLSNFILDEVGVCQSPNTGTITLTEKDRFSKED